MNKSRAIVLFLLLALVLIVSSACARKAEAPPKKVVEDYLEYLVKPDYEKAYSLCSQGFKRAITQDDFSLVNKRLRLREIVYSNPKVGEEKVIGNKAVVEYELNVKGGPMGGRRTFKGSARLIKENNKWRIEKIVGMPKEWLEKQ